MYDFNTKRTLSLSNKEVSTQEISKNLTNNKKNHFENKSYYDPWTFTCIWKLRKLLLYRGSVISLLSYTNVIALQL